MTKVCGKMNPNLYYRDLVIPFFSEELCDRATHIILEAMSSGKTFGHVHSDSDHLSFYDLKNDLPEMVGLMDACSIPADAMVFILPPNVVMPVHMDDFYDHRQSTIAIPLHPNTGYAGTNWYETLDSVDPVMTASWELYQPKLLNIRIPHGGIKTGHDHRLTIQISLHGSFETVLDLVEKGSLFRGYPCSFRAEIT